MFKTLHRDLGHGFANLDDYREAFRISDEPYGWSRGDGALSIRGTGWTMYGFNDFFSRKLNPHYASDFFSRNSILLCEDTGKVWWLSSGDGFFFPGSVTIPNTSDTEWSWIQGGWALDSDTALVVVGSWVTGSPYVRTAYKCAVISGVTGATPSVSALSTLGIPVTAIDFNAQPFRIGSYVYMYGVDYNTGNHYVVRKSFSTNQADYSAAWEAWTGSAWGAWASRAPVTIGSAPLRSLSVIPWNGGYLASAKMFDSAPEIGSPDVWTEVKGWTSSNPQGPWTAIGNLFDNTGAPGEWSYAARAEELPGVNGLSIVWSYNASPTIVEVYGPQFGMAKGYQDMSRKIIYKGMADTRVINATEWASLGIVGEPTHTWNKYNSYEQLVSDAAAVYLLATGDFIDENDLSFAGVAESLLNEDRFDRYREKIMKQHGTDGDWRSFNLALARRTAYPCDILVVGDSISEGWTCQAGYAPMDANFPVGDRDAQGWVGRMRRLLQLSLNSGGRGGQWVPAGAGIWGPPPWQWSANGTDIEVDQGLSLRGRQLEVAHANPATLGPVTCDGFRVHYNKWNVFGACNIKISVDNVQVALIDSFDGTLASFGTQPYEYVWTGTRGEHTLKVEAVANGGNNFGCQVLGAYATDGDNTTGVRVWNGAHFGYSLANYINADTSYFGSIQQGLIRPALVVIAMGTNDDPAQYGANLVTFVQMLNASMDVGGMKRPGYAIVIPPAANSVPDATRNNQRKAAYDYAEEINAEVWEWNELQGSVAVSDGNDPYAITYDIFGVKDNTHPGGEGHRMLGEYIAQKILYNTTPAVGLEVAHNYINSGRRLSQVIGNMGTAQTLDASKYSYFSGVLSANVTLTLSGALPGNRHTQIRLQIKQNATTARTVTFSPTVKWAGGTAYAASTTLNAIDHIVLDTYDGGTTWLGSFTKGHA